MPDWGALFHAHKMASFRSLARFGSYLVLPCCGAGSGAQAFAADGQAAVIRLGVDPASEQGRSARLHAALDRAFGPGKWRITSGYRSEARENELRAMGAGTVPVGVISHHSMGTPSNPGAYDVVVDGMDLSKTPRRCLRDTDPCFGRVLFEGYHGPEGAHLVIEVGDGSSPWRLGRRRSFSWHPRIGRKPSSGTSAWSTATGMRS